MLTSAAAMRRILTDLGCDLERGRVARQRAYRNGHAFSAGLMLSQRVARWRSRFWSWVETRAQPTSMSG